MIRAGDLDPRVARGFDRVAPIYDRLARVFPGDALRTTAETFVPRLRPGASVLVVGGGAGRILPALEHALAGLTPRPIASCGSTRRRR